MNRFENLIPELDEIVQVDEDGTIHMDNRLQAVISAIGQTMFQSAKMSFLQGMSVDSKLEKGLNGAMALDVVEKKMPLLNLAGDFLGINTKDYVKKNPKALFQLVGMLNKASGGNLLSQFLGNNGAQGPSQSRDRM